MVGGLLGKEYASRLKELGLTTLSERRHQADMLMMYKLMHGHGQLDEKGWFMPPLPAAARRRQHPDPLNVYSPTTGGWSYGATVSQCALASRGTRNRLQ
jgi:hypothetical protein